MMVSGSEQQFGRQKEWTEGSPNSAAQFNDIQGLSRRSIGAAQRLDGAARRHGTTLSVQAKADLCTASVKDRAILYSES
jgi:hypothetical protein